MAAPRTLSPVARALRGGAAACLLGLAVAGATATPISADAVSGLPGELVAPTVVDQAVVDFEGADLTLTFDPMVLSLVSVSPGAAFPGASLLSGPLTPVAGGLAQVALSFAIANGPFSGNDVPMLSALFQILPGTAPGFTTVHFGTQDPLVYDIDLDARVEVLAPVQVPEAGSGWLVLAACTALLAAQRLRRRHPAAAAA